MQFFKGLSDALPTARRFSGTQSRFLFRLTLTTYAVGAVIGGLLQIAAFADGAFFVYGIASGDPWHLDWDNMPVRVSTYGLTIEPLVLLVKAGILPLGRIANLYSLLFLGLPLVFLLLCSLLVTKRNRYLLAYPSIQLLTTGLFLFGFPTDLWVSQGEFWLALLAVIGGVDDRHRIPFFLVAFSLLLFSHDAAILLGGLITAALLARCIGLSESRKSDPFLLGYAVLLLAVWLIVKLTYVYPDPVLAEAIAHGAGGVINPLSLIRSRFFLLVFATAAIFCVPVVRWTTAPTRVASLVAMVLALIAAWLTYRFAYWVGSRYMLRGVALCAMLLLGALAVSETWRNPGEWQHEPATGPQQPAWVGWVFLLILCVATEQDVRNLAFARDWTTYRATVRSLTGGMAPTDGLAQPQLVSSAAADLPPDRRRLLANFSWGFALPFQSFAFSRRFQIDRMLYNPVPMPFGCATFKRTLTGPSLLSPTARNRIIAHVCAYVPGGSNI